MSFDDVMKAYRGAWDGDKAVIWAGGYAWIIANRVDGRVVLTTDGKRYVREEAPAVEEPKPRRGRKPAEDTTE